MNPADVLKGIRKTLDNNPDEGALAAIRTRLKHPNFLSGLTEYVGGLNKEDRTSILSDLVAISDHCGEKFADRKADGTNIRYGIASGLGIAAAGLLGFAAAPAMIILIFPGGWVAFRCGEAAKRLGKEEQLYQEIAARTTKILEKFDASGR
jgi:hypothetical protein